MTYLRLCFEFLKTGLFAVGGGLATLPFLYEISERTGWFSTADVSDMIAISECTPGPIGVNMATYVGFKTAGLSGGILATISLVAPSVLIIIMIAKAMEQFKSSQVVQNVLYGLRPASTALICVAGLAVCRLAFINEGLFSGEKISSVMNYKSVLLALLLFLGIYKFNKHPLVYIIIAAAAGVLTGGL